MSVKDIYDIEGAIETAVASVLNDAEVTGLTPQEAQTLQKDRPRAEVTAILGAGKQNHVRDISTDADPEMEIVEDAWTVTLHVVIITDAEIEVHTAYRSMVRYLMARLPKLINGKTLTRHLAHAPVRHAGSTPILKAEDGVYQTDSNYTLDVSIHGDAWALLNQ